MRRPSALLSLIFTALMSVFSVSSMALGADTTALSELETYKRCYIRMVREIPSESDSLLKAVKAGTKTANSACLSLFDKAQLVLSGTSYVLKTPTDETSLRILKTFNDLHVSWFSNKTHTFDVSPTSLLHDLEEPALYYTRAAFGSGVQFSSIVTLQQSLAGVREQMGATKVSNYEAQRLYSHQTGYPYTGQKMLVVVATQRADSGKNTLLTVDPKRFDIPDANLIESGRLKGIKVAIPIILGDLAIAPGTEGGRAILSSGTLGSIDWNQNMGGGIIGSQGFIMANSNLTANQMPNGVALINRRVTAKIYEDLLCLQLPTLTDADVASEVIPTSSYTFQQSTSCMRCHSTVDDSAFTMRNLFSIRSGPVPNVVTQVLGRPIGGVGRLPVTTGATAFSLQAPTGRMHYRENITGTRRVANLTSLADLGTQLSKGNDLYTCAAKKYYRFFTGIDVNLSSVATSGADKYHQDLVVSLGAKLKTTQSVRSMLDMLFKSDSFHSRNFKSEIEE